MQIECEHDTQPQHYDPVIDGFCCNNCCQTCTHEEEQ